jgi:hypothetical protein
MRHPIAVKRISPRGRSHCPRAEVDREVSPLHNPLRADRVPAQDGSHTGDELVHAERLGDVVVRAGVERGYLVHLRVVRREQR